MSVRHPLLDDHFESRLVHHVPGPLPHSSPHGSFIQHSFQPSYLDSSVHYQQHFYNPHQFFPGRSYRDASLQQTFQDCERRFVFFPDGNVSFFPDATDPGEVMFDENGCREKLSSPLQNSCKWSNFGKGFAKNKEMYRDNQGDSRDEDFYRKNDQLSPEVHNISDEGFQLKNHFYPYREDTRLLNDSSVEVKDAGKMVQDEGLPECGASAEATSIIESNNNMNNNSSITINNAGSSTTTATNSSSTDDSKGHVQPPWNWMKKQSFTSTPSSGKTRTKDKYRIVYTELQKVELEKEFLYNQYINLQRKSELAACIGLTDRQVKIWFQNRRAKDRKSRRKHEQMARSEQEQVQSTSSVFKPYTGIIADQFAINKSPAMDGFCQSQSAAYDFQEAPHSTFYEGSQTCQVNMKEVHSVAPVQRRHHMRHGPEME